MRGTTLPELLAAMATFALLFLAVDGVFIAAYRSTQQADLGAEVHQNARIAMERLLRELREADGDEVSRSSSAIAFRSARPADGRAFCVNVPTTTDWFYAGTCNYYGGPPVPGVDDYGPVWQRIVGYRLVAASGPAACGDYNLHRYVIVQSSPTAPGLPADPATPGPVAEDAVIASCVQEFTVSPLTGPPGKTHVTVTLRALGRPAQNAAVPPQEIVLTGKAWTRND